MHGWCSGYYIPPFCITSGYEWSWKPVLSGGEWYPGNLLLFQLGMSWCISRPLMRFPSHGSSRRQHACHYCKLHAFLYTSHHRPPQPQAKRSRDQVLLELVLIRVWVTIHKTISDLWLLSVCLRQHGHLTMQHPPSSTPHRPSPQAWTTLQSPKASSPCSRFFSRFLRRAYLRLPGFSLPATTWSFGCAIYTHPINSSTRPPYPDISSPSAVHLFPIRIVVVVHPSGAYSESFMRGSRQKKKKQEGGSYDKKRKRGRRTQFHHGRGGLKCRRHLVCNASHY